MSYHYLNSKSVIFVNAFSFLGIIPSCRETMLWNMRFCCLHWQCRTASVWFITCFTDFATEWESESLCPVSFIERFVNTNKNLFNEFQSIFFAYYEFQVLRLSQKALSGTASGKLVNLLSNDVLRFDNMFLLHTLWISPTTTAIAMYYLWKEIQWPGMIGVALILHFSPVQTKQRHFFF